MKVEAAGLDRGTWHLMTGVPYLGRLAFGLRRPKSRVPGRDLAGTVAAVGAEDKLAPAPTNLTLNQAAAVPISGMTAIRAIEDAGRLEHGQRVLVIGVCSTAKVDLVRSLGADMVIDYTHNDFAEGTDRYDLILDIGGSSSLSRLRRALGPEGALVIVGGEGGGTLTGMGRQLRALVLSPFLRQRLTVLVPKEHSTDLERLTACIEAGTVTPSIDCIYPLDRAADAMRRLIAGQVRGKVTISI